MTLSELYDADRARTDPEAARLRALLTIAHPLVGVRYADGRIADTTAGHVRCFPCRTGQPCEDRP